jgi:hypothetical protein
MNQYLGRNTQPAVDLAQRPKAQLWQSFRSLELLIGK